MSHTDINNYLETKFTHSDEYEKEHLKRDWDNKENSAKSILLDFKKRVGDPQGKKILDMGFGNGIMALEFAKAGAYVSGVEVDQILYDIAKQHVEKSGLKVSLSLYDGSVLPYADGSFDYIYSTSVLEHVDDPALFLNEAYRVLDSGGKMYLAFPNRFALRDSHTGLYLLGYFPRFVTEFILKVSKKGSLGDWNLHFISYWELKRIFKQSSIPFKVVMETRGSTPLRTWFKKLLARIDVHFGAFLSHIIIILQK